MGDVHHPSSTICYRPKAIIFDLLTALLDSWSVWDASVPLDSPVDGRTWRKRYLDITFKQGRYIPYEDLVRQAAQDVGLPLSAAKGVLQNVHQIQPWPEVPAALMRLRRAGLRLAVITNCSNDIGGRIVASLCSHVQEQIGESFRFDVVVTAEECGWYKPRPEAYRAGLEALCLAPDDVLFVAGSAGDVEGADGAGMKVVWNNHIGLGRRGDVEPWVEGRTLEDALRGVL